MRLTSLFKRRENPRDDFARRIMARLRERGWPHELTYDARRFAVALGDGGGGVMHLENTYREWLRFPEAVAHRGESWPCGPGGGGINERPAPVTTP